MGIQVEFNPDLALRDWSEFKAGRRAEAECVPSDLKVDKEYEFLKQGQRNYWLMGELPLLKTEGNQKLSKPIASIIIILASHFLKDGETWTKGRYKIVEVFKDKKAHFNGFAKI